MNMAGAAGLALLGVALFFNKFGEQSATTLTIIIISYALLTALPLVSLRALSPGSSLTLRRFAVGANWGFIGLWVLAAALAAYNSLGVLQFIPSAVLLVIPQIINIRALRKLNQA